MVTTIQLSEETKQMLEEIKTREKMKSFDEVIKKVLKKKTSIPESMFGAMKGLSWSKEDRLDLDQR